MDDEFVYSTDEGDLRKQKKGKKKSSRGNTKTPPGIKNDGIIRVQRESKGRGGKTVSVVHGMPVSEEELQTWATKLKQQCGTGGSVKSGTIIIQGDKVETIVSILVNAGFSAKRAGGWQIDGRYRENVKTGQQVDVVKKQDQGTGHLTDGVVDRILTKSAYHPHGIKVRLASGVVGRIKKIYK